MAKGKMNGYPEGLYYKAFRFLILGGSFYVRMLLQGQRGP
jgi:hypothetical protein